MKKFYGFILAVIFVTNGVFAKPVNTTVAMQVAQNFYRQTTHNEINTIALVYTAGSSKGTALYYVYNINGGFVIITADDAAQPIIGYSTEGNFVIPAAGTTIGNWLKKRGEEIIYIQEKNIPADAKITQKWNDYLTNATNRQYNSTTSSASPLCTTTWNQSPGYNALCPGNSVTGCVATAMAQIMKYWNYPATGNGSSSYMSNYGTLSVNYGATTYNWANMGNSITTNSTTDIATIGYHCGVSVEMNYSPSGSGAWVCSFDNPVCAQNSYINYFRYDSNTIQGLARSSYTDPAWLTIIKGDIDLGRPVQYVGWDPGPNGGGHTWVCDGYDQNDFLHMNWGWGGSANGYFFLNNMNGGGYNFSNGHEAVVGIVPIASTSIDASLPAIINPNGFFCNNNFSPSVKLQNMGASNLISAVISYKIDNNAVQTLNWNGSLVTGQFAMVSLPAFTATPGAHSFVCSVSSPNGGTDGNLLNDQASCTFNVSLGAPLPVVEGFESGTISPADWTLINTGSGNNFAVTNAAAATGANSIMIDNFTNAPGSTSIIQTTSNYDLTTYSSPTLSFKLAYQQKAINNNDRLQVFVSTDCGAGWMSKWAHWASTLPTVNGTSSAPFVPTPSQFTTYTVNLGNIVNSQNVMFRWKFMADVNGPGNNLYIDDINIVNSVTGIQSVENQVNLNVYPNPANGNFNVELSLTESKNVSVNIIDMLGRVIETAPAKFYTAGSTALTFGNSELYQSGIYFINLVVDGQMISKKVIVQ
jgi:hypothetical protein